MEDKEYEDVEKEFKHFMYKDRCGSLVLKKIREGQHQIFMAGYKLGKIAGVGEVLRLKRLKTHLEPSRKFCERCRKDSDILQGDFGELLCPDCYKETSVKKLNWKDTKREYDVSQNIKDASLGGKK